MKIEYKTVGHPHIKNREITYILIDNEIDVASSKFLTYEARYGGRQNYISGKKTHRAKAIKIGELYRHLYMLNKDWKTAIESDVLKIRNAMLCWDINNNQNHKNFNYQPISNNAMNQKLSTWFKFFKYMHSIGEHMDIVLTTKWIKVKRPKPMLHHLDQRDNVNNKVEVWTLHVKPSPKDLIYHALTRSEFEILRNELKKIDKVFEMIAYFMVETGLRVDAALNVEYEVFKNSFKHLNAGKTMDSCTRMQYINKGGEHKNADLPMRTIQTLKGEYFNRLRTTRLKKHSDNSDKGKYEYDENVTWLLENGRKVNYSDIQRAFKKASSCMARTQRGDRITTHWMRHTFATWTLIDYANENSIPLKNTGTVPNTMFLVLLSQKLGHASIETTMKYIATALKLMGVANNRGPIMSFRTFKNDKNAHQLLKEEAMIEFEDDFDLELFDAHTYGIARGIIVNDEVG